MVKPRLRKRLGDLLVEEGVISNDQLMAALKNQKSKGIIVEFVDEPSDIKEEYRQ